MRGVLKKIFFTDCAGENLKINALQREVVTKKIQRGTNTTRQDRQSVR